MNGAFGGKRNVARPTAIGTARSPRNEHSENGAPWALEDEGGVIVCVVDGRHVVAVSRASPVYLLTRGHQTVPVDGSRFRFFASAFHLCPHDVFDTTVIDDVDVLHDMCRNAFEWFDVTQYACANDVELVLASLRHRANEALRD
jgi:hypothetical protein